MQPLATTADRSGLTKAQVADAVEFEGSWKSEPLRNSPEVGG